MKNKTSQFNRLFGKRPEPIVLTSELKIQKAKEDKLIYLNYTIGSDTYPYEVISVSPNGKTVWAKEMDVRRKEGSESYTQNWEYISSSSLKLTKFTLRKHGSYRKVKDSSGYARPSYEPRFHYDYSF